MHSDEPTLPAPKPSPSPHEEDLSDSAIQRMLAVGGEKKSSPTDWQPPPPEEIQRLLPDYEVQALIGRGGMGAVYRGVQRSLDRAVAIKILPAEMAAGDPQFAARFKQEAKAMAKLSHANIVPVHDYGEVRSGGTPFAASQSVADSPGAAALLPPNAVPSAPRSAPQSSHPPATRVSPLLQHQPLHPSITPPLHHSTTPSLHHSNTPPRPPCSTPPSPPITRP